MVVDLKNQKYSFVDFFIVLGVILLSKSLYYESYGTNLLLFLSRFYDVKISFNMFVDNLFFGYGFGSQIENAIPYGEKLIGYKLYYLSKPTGADGITMFISQVGVLGLILIILLLIPKYYFHLDLVERFVITISMFLMFNTENFTFLLIFTVLIFYGIAGNQKGLHNETLNNT